MARREPEKDEERSLRTDRIKSGLDHVRTNVLPAWDLNAYPWFTVWPDSQGDPFVQPGVGGSAPSLIATYLEPDVDTPVRRGVKVPHERIVISEVSVELGNDIDKPDASATDAQNARVAQQVRKTILTVNAEARRENGWSTNADDKKRIDWIGEYFQTAVLGGRFGADGEFGLLWVRPACLLPFGCKEKGVYTQTEDIRRRYYVLVATRQAEGRWAAEHFTCHLTIKDWPTAEISDVGLLLRNAPLFAFTAADGRSSSVYAPIKTGETIQHYRLWSNESSGQNAKTAKCERSTDIVFTARKPELTMAAGDAPEN